MKLLYPEFLWALFAISIPIIIHLFNFRKFQKVYFSNIDVLKEVQLETKSKSQLKHLIILALRILAIAALVLAFCQPYIPTQDKQTKGDNVISIFIDNSYSMDSKGVNGYRLELAKEQASDLISNYGPTDQFQIITNDFEGRHQRLYNKTEAIQLIDEISPSFQSKLLSDVYTRQLDLVADQNANRILYWMSDFQKYTSDFSSIKSDSSIQLNLIPYLNESKSNLYIDSIWFETPVRKSGTEEFLKAKIVNASASPLEFKANLSVNGENQAFVNFNIEPETNQTITVPYTLHSNGVQHCQLTLTDYPDADLAFDDDYYFSYTINNQIKVLRLYEGPLQNDSSGYFGALFGKDNQFLFHNKSINNFDFSTLKGYDFLIIDNVSSLTDGFQSEVISFMNNGGSAAVFPAQGVNLNAYNTFIQQVSNVSLGTIVNDINKVSYLNDEHPIYQGIFDIIPNNIDLPQVMQYYAINSASNSGVENLMTLQNGNPFLVYYPSNKGNLTICAAPLSQESTNFTKHALFVPTMLRLAEFSQFQAAYSYTLGEDNLVVAPSGISSTDEITIASTANDFSFIPEVKITNKASNLLLYNQIKDAGQFDVLRGTDLLSGISFNYNRLESKQDFHTVASLKTALGNSSLASQFKVVEGADSENGIELQELVKGKKYWWHLIVIALVLLGLEILVFRLFK